MMMHWRMAVRFFMILLMSSLAPPPVPVTTGVSAADLLTGGVSGGEAVRMVGAGFAVGGLTTAVGF